MSKMKVTKCHLFFWNINRGTVPQEWEFFICDKNQCYTTTVLSCPCSKPNELNPGEELKLELHIGPNGVSGSGVLGLEIMTDCEGTNIVDDIPVTYNVEETSSTHLENINNKISIYPNPVNDYFNISDDNDVDEISIFNIVGKKIISLDHAPGQSHDISKLQKGLYLVRLIDDSQNILKAIRLTKK